jgi:hypothetical protein
MSLKTISFILLIILIKVFLLLKELLIALCICFTLKKSINKRVIKAS